MNPKGVTEITPASQRRETCWLHCRRRWSAPTSNPLPAPTLDLIRAAFEKASGGTLAQENFRVQAK